METNRLACAVPNIPSAHRERSGGTSLGGARCPARELRLGDVNGGAQLANKLMAAEARGESEQK
jgi:hypothetical protein